MKLHIIIVMLCALVAACGNNAVDSKTGATDTVTNSAGITECYIYIKDRDTITLRLTINDHAVSGNLNYSLFEKDKSQGVIQGEIRGDTLLADYEFKSEGIVSLREVAFLKKQDGYAEGYGEAEEKDGKMMFKNIAELNYSSSVVLKKTGCGS